MLRSRYCVKRVSESLPVPGVPAIRTMASPCDGPYWAMISVLCDTANVGATHSSTSGSIEAKNCLFNRCFLSSMPWMSAKAIEMVGSSFNFLGQRTDIYHHPTETEGIGDRPHSQIHLGFRENLAIWHRDLVLNEVPREVLDCDIAIYFSGELKDIPGERNAAHTEGPLWLCVLSRLLRNISNLQSFARFFQWQA